MSKTIKIKSKIKSKQKSGFPFSAKSSVGKVLSNVLLGLAVMAVGVGYLGNELSFCPWSDFTLFFPGWGSLFLIVPAAYALIRKPTSWFWAICLLGGVLILLSKQEAYSFATAASIVLAAAIILVGLRILLSPLFKRLRKKRFQRQLKKIFGIDINEPSAFGASSGGATSDCTYAVYLGQRTVRLEPGEFSNATISVSAGDMSFDASAVTVPDCAVIVASVHLGNLSLLLPADVRVELTDRHRMGNVENHHVNPADPDAPVVYVNLEGEYGNVSIG